MPRPSQERVREIRRQFALPTMKPAALIVHQLLAEIDNLTLERDQARGDYFWNDKTRNGRVYMACDTCNQVYLKPPAERNMPHQFSRCPGLIRELPPAIQRIRWAGNQCK